MKYLNLLLICIFAFQSTGCGTLLYPQRKGQKDGRIDAGVAILDGIGLLFFIIPGAIAFAVDFSNGTIYLPGTSRVMLPSDLKEVKFNPQLTSLSALEKIIKDNTGYQVCLSDPSVKVSKLKSTGEMMVKFSENSPQHPLERLAMR